MADVKRSTVEEQTARIKNSAPHLTVEQAKKIAVDSAERVNRERQKGKKR